MLYPITIWLWALLVAGPSEFRASHPESGGDTSSHVFSGELKIRPAAGAGDSAFYRELSRQLQNRIEITRPEKLYLHFDRTLYEPGETVWFNALLRNAGDLTPAGNSHILNVELLDPRGSVIQQKRLLARDGAGAGEFDLPSHLPGGLYKIKAWTNWMRNTASAFERTIVVQKVVLPNLNLKLQFERKAFGPGDVVIARFDALNLENKPLAGRQLSFEAQLQDSDPIRGEAVTDAQGRAYLRFPLPQSLGSSDGLLNIQVEHQGRQEAISRAIPIVLNKIDLQFFPEGGEMAGGLPCRVAFKALNEFGKPADVEGELLDGNGALVAAFSSFHDGMGVFDFTPRADGRYTARLTKPVASGKTYPLPVVQDQGYRLHVARQDAHTIYAEIAATQPGKVFLTATAGDQICFFQAITVGNTTQTVKIPTGNLPAGIVRLTLFDGYKTAQAERLAFVNRDRCLQIDIRPDRDQYLPRDKVRLDIRVRDHAGKPVEGAFSLAVADENLLTFADDKQGHLLAALLLEQDVKGVIEEPNFYFDPNEPKSLPALDYLLLTQGWRRFTWQEVQGNRHFAALYAPERAVVAGRLMRAFNEPAGNTAIKLHPDGPVVTTDAQGRFCFKHPDLSRYRYLEYEQQYYPINNYTENIELKSPGYVSTGIIRQKHAPDHTSGIKGVLVDDNGDPLIGASIRAFDGRKEAAMAISDFEGRYRLALSRGKYTIEVLYPGFQTTQFDGVKVLEKQQLTLDIGLASGVLLEEVTVKSFAMEQRREVTASVQAVSTGEKPKRPVAKAMLPPVIEQDKTQGGQTLTSDQIRNLPARSVSAIVATPAGTAAVDGGEVLIKGSRSNGVHYFVDGIRVKDDMAKRKMSAKPEPAYPYHRAREFYVPQYDQQQAPAERNDFRSTIYWNPSVKTDRDGKAQVAFYASDAITNFRATLEGVTTGGLPGRHETRFFVQKPVSISLKTPHSVISGDTLRLQIALNNRTALPAGGVLDLQAPAHFTAVKPVPETLTVPPGETKIVTAEYHIGQAAGAEQGFRVRFRGAETFEDAFETTIATLDRGFPVKRVISANSPQNLFDIDLNDPVSGSLSVKLTAYPSLLTDVLKGMERMLRQPSGCFEQVSSSTYPNLLVLDLLQQTRTVSPEIESRALQLIEDGYQKLSAYECKDGGFDWWGRSPAHEGLTAYGIMEFKDMSKVFPVDKQLIDRSVKWLLGRRDGSGGWHRRNDWHGWQSDGVIGAYIAWAVAEAGYGKQFRAETDLSVRHATDAGDPYQIALLANALALQNDPRAAEMIRLLLKKKDENGSWTGASHSVMGGTGQNLRVETTALAVLALLKTGHKDDVALTKAIEFLIKSKTEYGYGSTQSTVLALKALVEYAKLVGRSPADGKLVVQIDGKRVAEQAWSTQNLAVLEIGGLEQHFTGHHARVEVFFEGTEKAIPFDIEVQYASRQPRNAAKCPLAFQTTLANTKTAVGNTVRLSATLRNETAGPLASPMIVLGIPAGLSLQPWQLKQLGEQKKWDFYELWDGFAVFHFETLAPNETRRIDLDLRADIPGVFEAPASQAFLYYDNEQRVWSKPERVKVL